MAVHLSCSKKMSDSIILNKLEAEEMANRDLHSEINLNFKINKDSINKSFNVILDSLFVNETDVSAMGFNVEVLNLSNASLEIQGKQVLTKLPLQINLSKETFISDIDIDASLEVTFITSLEVDSIWQVETETELEDYKWLKKPELSLGGINIGVKSLANIIIAQSKTNLENQIDSIIVEQFKLKDQIERMMFFLKDPLLIDSTLSRWLNFKPDSILLSQINNGSLFYNGNIAVHGTPLILSSYATDQKQNSEIELPELVWIDPKKRNSILKLNFDISLDKLTQYANNNFADKPLSNGDREIILSDIIILKSNDKLSCTANVKGDFNGRVIITGTPEFDHKNQSLVTKNVDIEFKTDNVLHKTGLWLMKGKIKNKLSSMLNFSLEERVKDLQSTINNQVKQLSEDYKIDLKCDVNKIIFNEFLITEEDINVFVIMDLYLESTINNLLDLQVLPE